MDENKNVNVNLNGMGDELVKAVHGSKSYVGHALITLVLYYVGFYFVGLIANLLFLSQTKESKRITGRSPSGSGCLSFLLWVHFLIPVILIILLFTVGLGGIMSMLGR